MFLIFSRTKIFSKKFKEDTDTMTHTDNLCLGMAAVYSFFGITLAVAPKLCWGPESPLSYWTEMDESGVWFGRAVGVCA